MIISKTILARFCAIIDSQTLFTLCRSRKILEAKSRTFYLRLRLPAYSNFLQWLQEYWDYTLK